MAAEITVEPAQAFVAWDSPLLQLAKLGTGSRCLVSSGFTSNLICMVWVGNDDYTPTLRSLKTASCVQWCGMLRRSIWAAFMKQAVQLPQYSDTNEFVPPDGVQLVTLDKATNLLADGSCPEDYTAAFLDGTAPTEILRTTRAWAARTTATSSRRSSASRVEQAEGNRRLASTPIGRGCKLPTIGYSLLAIGYCLVYPSTSNPSGIGWHRGHQKVTRASAP